MRIRVNGRSRDVADGISIAQLLQEMSLEPRRIAVERNQQLVPRARHGETALTAEDELEIVTLVGGG